MNEDLIERDCSPFSVALISDASFPLQVIPLNWQSVIEDVALADSSYSMSMSEGEMVDVSL